MTKRNLFLIFPGAVFICALSTLCGSAAAQNLPKPATYAQHEEKLNACGILRHPSTRYVLQQDVQSAGTCFAIEADNVTLDLNGHTATYAAGGGGVPAFGVLSADCWYAPIAGNPCGGSHRHPTVMNGTIVQGPAAAPFSHGLRFGQGNNLTGMVVHNLTITVHSADSIAIYSEYLPGGSDIYGNTILNQVRSISSRTQFRGASIKLDNEDAATLPDSIHDNIIRGGAQIGIRSDNPAGTKIFRNDISQDAIYANGFCIDAAGNGMQVSGNYCHPVHGRGLHANHSNVTIDHNIVETIDTDKIAEYKGCELNGTYGIQVENDGYNPQHMVVANNKVTVHARECAAEAMRVTDLHDADVKIHDNTFTAVADMVGSKPSEAGARAFSVGDVDGAGMQIFNNAMTADSAIFYEDWDSATAMTLKQNIFQAGAAGNHTLLAEFGNGARESRNIFFLDSTFRGIDPLASRFGEYAGNSWYAIGQSVTVRPHRSDGQPMKEAHGVVKVGADEMIAAADLEADGSLVFDVPLQRIENKQPVKHYGPYEFILTSPGCKDFTTSLGTVGGTPLSWTLSCN